MTYLTVFTHPRLCNIFQYLCVCDVRSLTKLFNLIPLTPWEQKTIKPKKANVRKTKPLIVKTISRNNPCKA